MTDEGDMALPGDPILIVEDADRVRTLTFNRPGRANAFNGPLYLAAAGALDAAAADDGVAVVVLTGAGRSFSAGTDLEEMAAIVPAAAGNRSGAGVGVPFDAFFDALTRFGKPLLAAVNGPGIGLGLTMLAHCDLVLVAEQARLLAPFTAMGVAPEMASSYLLPRRMGAQRAAEVLYTAEWLSATDAVEAGLALRAVPGDRLLAETQALAATIAAKPLASLMATKRLVAEAEREGIRRAHHAEAAAFSELLRRPAMAEAILGRLDEPEPSREPAP